MQTKDTMTQLETIRKAIDRQRDFHCIIAACRMEVTLQQLIIGANDITVTAHVPCGALCLILYDPETRQK